MAGLKENQRFVIFDGPERRGGQGTRYFSKDGTSTEYRSKAAKFFTATDTIKFATLKTIRLDGLNSVGKEDFTGFDLRGLPWP